MKTWTAWGLDVSVAVTEPGLAAAAEQLVRAEMSAVDHACSRFRTDSELARLQPALAGGTQVSPLLVLLVGSALEAARWTGGAVDPTLGRDMEDLGYDRDISQLRLGPGGVPDLERTPRRPRAGWQQVHLDGQTLRVPPELRLDLGATAKAVAADRAANSIAAELGCGALVSLGGDIATAGDGPDGGWQVLVQDLPGDPWQQVTLLAGRAMATSSTQKRRWHRGRQVVHHILDPSFGTPAEPVWRSVTVSATSCLQANAFSTAGIVRGFAALDWFGSLGVAARLVDRRGRVATTGTWPRPGADGNRDGGSSASVTAAGSHG